jgi:Family of unknown function (DUF5719)
MRAVLRTGLVALSGAGLVLGAIQLPDLHYRMAGSGGPLPATGVATAGAVVRAVSSTSLVCPGPETVGAKGVDAKAALAPTVVRAAVPPADLIPTLPASASGSAVAEQSPGSVTGTAVGAATGVSDVTFPTLTTPGAVESASTSGPRSVLFAAQDSLAPGLVAAQTTLITSGDLRGLSSAACQAPTGDTWLVGGAGTTGRRARVILTNPSPNAVTVDLDVFGTKGQVAAAAGRGIVVGAQRRVVVLLAAIAPHEKAPVIHVEVSGGLVSATLSDGLLDGTTPGGSDDVVGTTAGRHLVIPGVLASGTPGSTILRIASTGAAAKVQLRVLTADGPAEAPVRGGVVSVRAHRAKNVDLSKLAAGNDAIELTANAAVVAGVQLQRSPTSAGVKGDLAWTSAQPAISSLGGLPIGLNAAPWANQLVLTAATRDANLTLSSRAADGTVTAEPVLVEAGTTKTVSLSGAPWSVWLRMSSGVVTAALATTYADPAGPMLTIAPLAPPALQVRRVSVYAQAG